MGADLVSMLLALALVAVLAWRAAQAGRRALLAAPLLLLVAVGIAGAWRPWSQREPDAALDFTNARVATPAPAIATIRARLDDGRPYAPDARMITPSPDAGG